jgi:hypothetical protein
VTGDEDPLRAALDDIAAHINACGSCSTCVAHDAVWAVREILDLTQWHDTVTADQIRAALIEVLL